MKKNIMIVALLLFLSGCGIQNAPTGNNGNGQTSVKFSDQPYYNQSYLISGDTLSPEAQAALSGFSLDKKPNSDGTVQITLKALQPQYHDQQFTLKPGEQLYFIEKTLGDDQPDQDNNTRDDSGVVVDSQGNVVQGPTDFSQ